MLLAVFAIAAGIAAAPSPTVVTDPQWTKTPSPELASASYPVEATVMGFEGEVEIECRVTAKGRLRDCIATKEEPKGHDFAKAALSLTDRFEMKLPTVGGKPLENVVVRYKVPFRMGETAEPTHEGLQQTVFCYGVIGAAKDADPSRIGLDFPLEILEGWAYAGGQGLNMRDEQIEYLLAQARSAPLSDEVSAKACWRQAEGFQDVEEAGLR